MSLTFARPPFPEPTTQTPESAVEGSSLGSLVAMGIGGGGSHGREFGGR